MDVRLLAERLIGYDTSTDEGIRRCAGFIDGWLESHDVETRQLDVRELPILVAEVGPERGPTIVIHGHLDVVPGLAGQFEPRVEGDRLIGRGAYDMKGALAAMLLTLADLRDLEGVRLRLAVVPDEEIEEVTYRGSDVLVDSGFGGDFAITGEPTDMHIGVAAKGVLAMRLEVTGRAAHGATPWEGDNAIVKALDAFREIEALPFTRESSELFDRPSLNLGRISGGDALNKVPDLCVIDVDVRYLPEQEPETILGQVAELPDVSVLSTFTRPPVVVDRDSAYVRALVRAAAPHHDGEVMSVGRDGASDAVSFLRAGIPTVEFGPIGDGHHGPEEWVSIESLRAYRQALASFIRSLPEATEEGLEAVGGEGDPG